MKKYSFLLMMCSAWCQQQSYEAEVHTTRELNNDGTISNHTLDTYTGFLPELEDNLTSSINAHTHQELVTHDNGEHTINMQNLPYPASEFLESISFRCKESILCDVRFPNASFPNASVIESTTTGNRIKKAVYLKEFDDPDPVIANTEDLNSMLPDLDNLTNEDFITLHHLNTGQADPQKQKLALYKIYDMERIEKQDNNDAVFKCAITCVDTLWVLTNHQTGQHQRLNIQNDGTIVQSSFEDLHGDVIPLPIVPQPLNPRKFCGIPDYVAQHTFSLRKIPDQQ